MANYVDLDNQQRSQSMSLSLGPADSFGDMFDDAKSASSHSNVSKLSDGDAVLKFLNRSQSALVDGQVVIDELEAASGIKYEDIEIFEEIGSGYFGVVCKGKWNDKQVALKKIRRASFRDDNEFTLMAKECAIMSQLNHPNIVEFFGIVKDPINPSDYVMVTEFQGGGSLRDRIDKRSHTINDPFRVRAVSGIAKGMSYLHSLSIVHRDLTCANILLSAESNCRALICDFGLSRVRSNSQKMTAAMGSLAYMAPEIFRGEKYDQSCDVFSFAVVLWEMVTLRPMPPSGMTPHLWASLVAVEQRRPSLIGVPERYVKLLEQCWSNDTSKRPSFEEIDNYTEQILMATRSTKHAMSSLHLPTNTSMAMQPTASMARAMNRQHEAVQYSDVNSASSSLSPASSLVHAESSMTAATPPDGGYLSDHEHSNATKSDQYVIHQSSVYRGHQGYVCCVHANQGSDTLLTGSTDGSIKVWSLDKLKSTMCRHTISGHDGYVFCLASGVVNDKSVLVSGSRDQTIRLWDPSGNLLEVLTGHKHGVRDIALGKNMLVSASEDATVKLWDLDTGACSFTFEKHKGIAYSCSFLQHQREDLILSASADALIYVWDARSGKTECTLKGHTNAVQRIRSGLTNSDVFSCSSDSNAMKWDLRTQKCVVQYTGHHGTLFDIDVQKEKQVLSTAGGDGLIHFYDIESGQLKHDLRASTEAVLCLTSLNEGSVVISGNMEKTMVVHRFQ